VMKRFLLLALVVYQLHVCSSTNDPGLWKAYLTENLQKPCATKPSSVRFPLSFLTTADYFNSVPADQRVSPKQQFKAAVRVPACKGKDVSPAVMNDYLFQSEQLLTLNGLNIYDGSVRAIALALFNDTTVIPYENQINLAGTTCQFSSIKGDKACKGIMVKNQCSDPNQEGVCGFCYGDGISISTLNAWTFRQISDYWAIDGSVDKRCPELNQKWSWNDYKPVLGENSWANLIGPLQVAYLKYGGVTNIPSNDISIQLALNFLQSVYTMTSPIGGVFYSPKNTLSSDGVSTTDLGYSISLENNVSLMAGLRALRYILITKNIHMDQIAELDSLLNNITGFVKQSYDPSIGYFRQGGSYDPISNQFKWATGSSGFAVDCQTWVMSVVNPLLIDQWYGAGTARNIWVMTKKLGGYRYNGNTADGLGFSVNNNDQVFSGEWTFGGINMLRIFANIYSDSSFLQEANTMRNNIQTELFEANTVNGKAVTGIRYANKRYFIPFGWWANPILSTASTGWAALIDSNYNPFHLGGQYVVDY